MKDVLLLQQNAMKLRADLMATNQFMSALFSLLPEEMRTQALARFASLVVAQEDFFEKQQAQKGTTKEELALVSQAMERMYERMQGTHRTLP